MISIGLYSEEPGITLKKISLISGNTTLVELERLELSNTKEISGDKIIINLKNSYIRCICSLYDDYKDKSISYDIQLSVNDNDLNINIIFWTKYLISIYKIQPLVCFLQGIYKYMDAINDFVLTNTQIYYNTQTYIYMLRQFTYKYVILGMDSEAIRVSYIGVLNYDKTFDKANNDKLLQYHHASKPHKININWEYSLYKYCGFLWMDENEITRIFERFYGAHPETKADFIIKIDAENKKYELALYRQGLKEPVVIPESAYQLIVFKNKFEDYRSENYNQPRGAWIW